MRHFVISLAMLGFATCVYAQGDEAVLRGAMKQVGPLNGGLGKKIAAKDATAAADAEKLHALFGDVKKFWHAKGAADAVEFAEKAAGGYSEAAKHAGAGQWEEAAASQKKAGSACMGCHSAHREKAEDGSWKIK